MDFDFTAIGLNQRDKIVYETLLAQPQISLRRIADQTGTNRGSVYESIKELLAIGLVGIVRSGKQQKYVAQDPRNLLELLKERQRQTRQAEAAAENYIKQLASKHHTLQAETPSFGVYYQDDDGIAAILRDVLTTMRASSERSYDVISSKRIRHYLYNNFPNFTRSRIEAGVGVRVIAIGEGGSQDELAHRRWLYMEAGQDPNCYTLIYAHKTAFITINDQNVLNGIVIDNNGITEVQRETFQRLWNSLEA